MKQYHIEFMSSARAYLLEIGEYIALDNPQRAVTFIDEIIGSLQKQLSIFPFSGKRVEDLELDEEIRVMTHGNYNSYQRVIEDRLLVEVLFVFNARRNIQALITGL